jgi:Family of unknown function (DUF6152)
MRQILALVFGMASCAAAFAHHSRAYFDNSRTIQLVGEILDVRWRNPHISFTLAAVNDRGLPEKWIVEGAGVYEVLRAGITPEMLAAGKHLTVAGPVSTREQRTILAEDVVFAGGEERSLVAGGLVGRYDDAARLVDAAAESRGIFRVWSVPAANMVAGLRQLGDQPFTASAISARGSWDALDNFATRCEPEGMPRIMVNPHPFEFVDRGSEIILRTELYDIARTIHMDRRMPAANEPSSPLGYSVGAWDGRDLVVTTTRINWPYFDTIGTPLSEAVEIVERFSLSDDQARLDFDITVADPSTFTSPAKLRGYWLALGESIPRYDCVPLAREP